MFDIQEQGLFCPCMHAHVVPQASNCVYFVQQTQRQRTGPCLATWSLTSSGYSRLEPLKSRYSLTPHKLSIRPAPGAWCMVHRVVLRVPRSVGTHKLPSAIGVNNLNLVLRVRLHKYKCRLVLWSAFLALPFHVLVVALTLDCLHHHQPYNGRTAYQPRSSCLMWPGSTAAWITWRLRSDQVTARVR